MLNSHAAITYTDFIQKFKNIVDKETNPDAAAQRMQEQIIHSDTKRKQRVQGDRDIFCRQFFLNGNLETKCCREVIGDDVQL